MLSTQQLIRDMHIDKNMDSIITFTVKIKLGWKQQVAIFSIKETELKFTGI